MRLRNVVALLLMAVTMTLMVNCATPPRTPTEKAARSEVDAFLGAATTPVRSLRDAEQALRSDHVVQMTAAVAWTRQLDDDASVSLRAQLLLAIGESEWLIARALERSGREALGQAFRIVAAEDVAAGLVVAERAIQRSPDAYVGHRIAADAYRLRAQWQAFDEEVAAVERLKPDSNGLRFLRAMEALQRAGDVPTAVGRLHTAVQTDPGFVRAWVQLALLTNGLYRDNAVEQIRKHSPQHPFLRAVR
jgi:hypothetical protein